MLDIRVEGEEHPKKFFLVTDDSDGELARLEEILDEVDADPEDTTRIWLAGTSAEQFAESAEIPPDEVGEFAELLEQDWPHAYDVIAKQRRDAMEKLGGE